MICEKRGVLKPERIQSSGERTKAPPAARDDPEDDLAAFVQRNGLEDFLSPEKEPRPR